MPMSSSLAWGNQRQNAQGAFPGARQATRVAEVAADCGTSAGVRHPPPQDLGSKLQRLFDHCHIRRFGIPSLIPFLF